MIDLSVDIGGIKLKSPIFLAAGPLTADIRLLQKAVETGVGAVDTKATIEDRYPKTKSYQRTFWDQEIQALFWNIGRWDGELLHVDDAARLITSLKAKCDVPVFGNIPVSSEEPETVIRIGSRLEKAGADMVIDEETSMGQMLSQKIMENITESSGSILACRLAGQTPEVSV